MEIASILATLGLDISGWTKGWEDSAKSLEENGKKLKKMGTELTEVFTLEALAIGTEAVYSAGKLEQANQRVAASLSGLVSNVEEVVPGVERYLKALEGVSGFQETALTNSFNKFLLQTRDAKVSVDALSAATVAARGSGQTLETATNAISAAMNGHSRALREVNINLRNGASQTEVLAAITQKYGTDASKYLDNIAGKTEIMRNKLEGAAITLGTALMPYAIAAVNVMTTMADKLAHLATWFNSFSSGVKTTVVVVVSLLAALGPAIYLCGAIETALAAILPVLGGITLSMLTTVAGVLAFVAVGVVVVANWEKVKAMLASIFYGILFVVADVVKAVIGQILNFISIIPGLSEMTKKLQGVMDGVTDSLGNKFSDAANKMQQGGGFIGNTVDFVKGKLGDLQGWLGLTGQKMGTLGTTATDLKNTMNTAWSSIANSIGDGIAVIGAEMQGLAKDMVQTLVTGTGDWQTVLKSFLQKTLIAVADWAIKIIVLDQLLAQAQAWAISNPFLAIGIIGGLLITANAIANSGPKLAAGGIAMSETSATIGEAGPEAVIPLNSSRAGSMLAGALGGGGSKSQTIIVELDGQVLAQAVVQGMPGVLRLQGMRY